MKSLRFSPQSSHDFHTSSSSSHKLLPSFIDTNMLFLDSSERLGDFVVNLLYALGSLIGTTHFTISPDPPQPKFAAEVGVLSGVSYEQPIGGKFSLVGKAGV
ncbi:hypothetical protein, partial [Alloprevotella sp. oral taxon 473]|uniref:hypothetical protein n=1 Tax=Alloprevotella sp. oral taxon 473 TaxID=712469 RepID=UPI0018DCF624